MSHNDERKDAGQLSTVLPHFYSELASTKRKERGAALRSSSYNNYLAVAYGAIWSISLLYKTYWAADTSSLQDLVVVILGVITFSLCARALYLQQKIENIGHTIYLYDTIQIHNDALHALQDKVDRIESTADTATPSSFLEPPIPSWNEHGPEACIEWFLRYARPRGTTQREFAEEVGISERHLQRRLKEYRDRHESHESV